MSFATPQQSILSGRTHRAFRAAILSAAAAMAVGGIARADILYTASWAGSGNGGVGTDGGYWFYGGSAYTNSNWVNTSVSTTTPVAPPTSLVTANIDANTGGVLPTLGAVFDPVNDPGAAGASSAQLTTLYISSSSSSVGTFGVQPNTMTVDSGSLEASNSIVVGRDAAGLLVQNGGTLISDGTFGVGAIHADGNQNGTLIYHGGLLQAGISSAGALYTGSSGGMRLGLGTLSGGSVGFAVGTGTLAIYNDGPAGAVDFENLYTGYGAQGLGVVEYHYGNGGIRPIQLTGNPNTANGGQLALRNYSLTPAPGPTGGIGSELNLVLNQAPLTTSGVPNSEALVTYTNGIHGESTYPKIFYDAPGSAIFNSTTDTITDDATGGSVGYAEGGEVDAVYNDVVYRWDLYYDGSVSFSSTTTVGSNTYSPNSAVTSIAQTGGNGGLGTEAAGVGAVVLIGVGTYNLAGPTPEPATIGLLGGVAAMAIARRRRRGE
jgi:hypothetical protein